LEVDISVSEEPPASIYRIKVNVDEMYWKAYVDQE
jgi:hypothetical protein